MNPQCFTFKEWLVSCDATGGACGLLGLYGQECVSMERGKYGVSALGTVKARTIVALCTVMPFAVQMLLSNSRNGPRAPLSNPGAWHTLCRVCLSQLAPLADKVLCRSDHLPATRLMFDKYVLPKTSH